MDRTKWTNEYRDKSLASFSCPTCSRGVLNLQNFTNHVSEHMRRWRGHENYYPLDDQEQFSATLICSNPSCGEIIVVCGRAIPAEYIDEDHQFSISDEYTVDMMTPAPPIIAIPPETPHLVRMHLRKSFSLYWIDLGACANKLRVCVEAILDDLKVPNGPILSHRITAFQKNDPENGATFDALRIVGNGGSHSGDAEREHVLDSFELMEEALAELYGRRKERLQEIRKRIIDSKPKKKPA